MSNYQLLEFTDATFESTKEAWLKLMDEDAFELEMAPLFGWAKQHMNHADGDSVALRLYDDETGRTDAIVEVVSSRKGQMSKLLKVIPSPRFWDINNQRAEILQLYVDAFVNVITSRGFKANHKVKIYGRDDDMLSILRSIHSAWSFDQSKADFEGRFLTITWG